MVLNKITLFVILSLTFYTIVCSQDTINTSNRFSLKLLPVVFYTPESRWGGGIAGVSSFNFKGDSVNARKSSVNIGAAYTQLNQLLAYLPFQLFPKNYTYSIYGEFGYYLYNYYYYGISHNAVPAELYEAEFSRIRLSALKRVYKNTLLGVKYVYDKIRISALEQQGEVFGNSIIGAKGGAVSGIGLVMNYDSRNHVFFPSKGLFAEAFYYIERKFTGSLFNYNRATIDVSYYYPLKKQQVMAFNFYAVNIVGDVPFTHLGLVGGVKKARGYYEGRYRDKNLLMLQSEYRFNIYKRFGAVLFTAGSWISPTLNEFRIKRTILSGGLGLRYAINKNDKINLRLDFGIGKNSTGFYFTIGEAF